MWGVSVLQSSVLSIRNSDLSGLSQPCVSKAEAEGRVARDKREGGQPPTGWWRPMPVNRGQDPATRAALCSGPAPEVWPPTRLSHVPWQLPMVDGELGVVRAPKCTCPAGPYKGRPGTEGELRAVVTNKQVNIQAA